jgi:hypothetical protein
MITPRKHNKSRSSRLYNSTSNDETKKKNTKKDLKKIKLKPGSSPKLMDRIMRLDYLIKDKHEKTIKN